MKFYSNKLFYFPPDKMEEEKQTQPCWHTEDKFLLTIYELFSSSCLTELLQQYKSWQRSYLRRGKLLYSLLVSSADTLRKTTHRKLRAIHLVLASLCETVPFDY